ncbi:MULTISPECIES: hypothetical protein [Mycolicibacterium]|nr:hypothetical protein C6A88_31070 [Mycolicibacterium austroafricanum]QRZ08507.1 hypothetical protein JN090_08310 [Mycolicibacterium austroafricanum]QZT58677.1 hypothetical protein JN084_08940 [Mycolicibacterium austroafricanum]QZT63854.1 hypothetical protein JN085_05655 [Mycolicibacterium austroafricanum]QZT70158.1 hypothetical protein JN086_09250 [Mycolicibacterium austroafricanum]
MTEPDVVTWLIAGYALLLTLVAWGFDVMAKRTSHRAAGWRTGGFVYHPSHDAWQCPQDEWLWPTSFDPNNRVMRYRAKPAVCNHCPVKADCTESPHGREISRHVDPWPFSEAGRFHRGIACAVAALAILMPLGQALSVGNAADLLVGGITALVVALVCAPLFRHLWVAKVIPPEHIPHRSAHEEAAAAAIDKYSTKWGVGPSKKSGDAS